MCKLVAFSGLFFFLCLKHKINYKNYINRSIGRCSKGGCVRGQRMSAINFGISERKLAGSCVTPHAEVNPQATQGCRKTGLGSEIYSLMYTFSLQLSSAIVLKFCYCVKFCLGIR